MGPLIAALLVSGAPAAYMTGQGGEWDVSGYVATEVRGFLHGPQFSGQENHQASIIAEPEFYIKSPDNDNSFTFVPFVRVDSSDEQRTHMDIRELNVRHVGDGWEVMAGIGKVFWGVTESRHLVDIINQDDGLEDIDGEDKLGQPMIELTAIRDWGTVSGYLLPGFRERRFPGKEGRLRSSLLVDEDQAAYESALQERHVDTALRYKHFIDEWDFGLSHFYGTSREPRFELGADGNGSAVLVPHYDIINQTGLDVQATYGAWLWKMEGIYRTGQGRDFFAGTGGLEYTFFGVAESDMDVGLLAEYHFDDRGPAAPPTLFDSDVFFGTRLTFNDVQSSELLAGTLIDTNNASTSFQVEASRRFGDRWKMELEARLFSNGDRTDFYNTLVRDDHVQLRVSWYF